MHSNKIRRRTNCVCLSAALLMLASGCQFSPQLPLWPTSLTQKTEPQLPDRITPFWTDTVLHQPKQPGVRGFGGRVYFYRNGNQDSIEVDGGLVVYAFDNEAPVSEASKPLKKYVFTADQFATHMSRTDMGPSYSIWLPWDEVGGETKQLSLVTRFEGREGGVVISDPTIKLLPGVNKQVVKDEAEQGGVRPASFISGTTSSENANRSNSALRGEYLQHIRSASETNAGRQAMTIDLPPSFQRHLSGDEQISRFDGPRRQQTSGSPLREDGQRSSEGAMNSIDAQHLNGEQDLNGERDSRSANFESVRPAASNLFPPGLRNTFRRNVKDDSEEAAGQQKPNSRPANWLVAPR